MLNFTAEEFNDMLKGFELRKGHLEFELTSMKSQLKEFHQKQDGIEKELKENEEKCAAVQKALILIRGVSPNVSKTRDKLLNKVSRESKTDSIAERLKLQTEIKAIKEELVKACPHPFIFHKHGYEGNNSHDHEDSYPSERYCVVCGFEERAKNLSGNAYVRISNDFKDLINSDNRIIQNEPFRPYPESLKKINILVSLGAVLKPFEESVTRVLNG